MQPRSRALRRVEDALGLPESRATNFLELRIDVFLVYAQHLLKLLPIQNHFAAVGRAHHLKRRLIIFVAEPMCNHRHDVEARLQQHRHLVPGLIHLAAVDAFDVQHVKDDIAPVDGHLLSGNTQHRDAPAMGHVRDHFAKGRWVARHFQTHIEALPHAECFLSAGDRVVFHVERQVHFDFAGEIQPVLIDVRDHDVAGPGVADHCGGHDADGARAGYQHVLAEHIKRERSVYGIAQGIEDRGGVAVQAWIVPPDVGHRQSDVLREAAGPVHSDARGARTQLAAAGHAVAAAAAHYVAFARDQFAGTKIDDIGADLNDLANEFMPDRHRNRDRLLGPGIPVVDVHVGAADPCAVDADQNSIDAEGGLGDVFEPKAWRSVRLDECFHRISRLLWYPVVEP